MTAADSIPTYKRSPFIKAFLSLIIPGLGQVWYGDYRRGLAVFLAVATALATVAWFGQPGWYALIFAMWAWNVWDAARLPLGASITLMTLLWLAVAFGIGWQVTEINPRTLVENRERAQSIIRPMLRPDFLAIHQEEFQGWVDVQVPCSIQTPRAENTVAGIHISVSPDCASLLETLLVTAEGLWPDSPADITWATPIGAFPIWRKLISLHMSGGTTGGGWDLPGIGWTSLFVGSGVAIHSTFWHNNFGEPMSRGCVNASPEDAKWVFRWTMPVVTYNPGDTTVAWPGGTKVEVIET